MSQSVNQSVSESVNQSVSESVNQSFSESISESVSEPVSEFISKNVLMLCIHVFCPFDAFCNSLTSIYADIKGTIQSLASQVIRSVRKFRYQHRRISLDHGYI